MGWMAWVQFPAGAKDFLYSTPRPALGSTKPGGSSLRVKVTGTLLQLQSIIIDHTLNFF
jgi:hypothetical protein